MAKLELEKVKSGYQSSTVQNINWTKLEDIINSQVLFRGNPEGEPNQMLNTLDMNSNRIINIVDAITSSEPATLRQLLQLSNPDDFIASFTENQVATQGQTTFTLAAVTYEPAVDNLSVYINGVYQNTGQYAQPASNQIIFNSPTDLGDSVDFVINQRNVTGAITAAANVTYTPVGGSPTNLDAHIKILDEAMAADLGSEHDRYTDVDWIIGTGITTIPLTTPIVVGINLISVYINGVRQAPVFDYTESSETQIVVNTELTLIDAVDIFTKGKL